MTDQGFPYKACKTRDLCRREEMCFDTWNCVSDQSFVCRGGNEGSDDTASSGGSSQTPPAVDAYAPAGDFFDELKPISVGDLSVLDAVAALCKWAESEMQKISGLSPAELEADAKGSFYEAIRAIGEYHRARGTRPTGGYFTQTN